MKTKRRIRLVIAAAFVLILAREGIAQKPSAVGAVSYHQHIRPILADNCYACHGPDEKERQADLRLDTYNGLFGDREGAVAVKPGQAAASQLLQRIAAHDPDQRMPPPDSGKRLSPAQIEMIKQWVEQGAPWSSHWAYASVRRPALPRLESASTGLNPIDYFWMARLEKENLQPASTAQPHTLVRRLFFDLTGLPPTPQDVESFLRDNHPRAVERLAERLLASPAFGERMAVFWLDLVRYADTVGYHGDQEHPISAYRDYVIKSFNEGLPFDQFTIEQLAGDLLPQNVSQNVSQTGQLWRNIATGYNRLLQTTHEGGAQDQEYLVKYAADRVRNASSVWLGSTLGCAQCHDHKYDPFTQRDFYRFAAYFADVQERGAYRSATRPPEMPAPSLTQLALLEDLQRRIAQSKNDNLQKKKLEQKKAALLKSLRPTMITVAAAPRLTRLLPRGDWLDESGPIVQPGPPGFLATFDAPLEKPDSGARRNRLDLAHWLTSPENPLTARVLVNRLWKLFFGRGLAPRLDDFGAQGAAPSHPKLLDWLAAELIDSQWDIKHLVRLMVTSAAYRRSSQPTAELLKNDPQNRWFARQTRVRREAEFLRDNALAMSGMLVHRLGGRSVRPYQPAGYYRHLNFPKRTYKHDVGENQYRRGVYSHWQRVFLHPMLKAFDAPSREECTAQRPISNTPLAALALLNDPSFVECARAFAERIVQEGGQTTDERIVWAWRTALSRQPTQQESQALRRLLKQELVAFQNHPAAAKKLLAVGLTKPAADINAGELAAWTSAARAILNLHETIMRN